MPHRDPPDPLICFRPTPRPERVKRDGGIGGVRRILGPVCGDAISMAIGVIGAG
jgi:hypothetical protein